MLVRVIRIKRNAELPLYLKMFKSLPVKKRDIVSIGMFPYLNPPLVYRFGKGGRKKN